MTPDKASLIKYAPSPQSTGPASDKLTSSTKSKLASLTEPSPASTYGDTVGSSMPATPLETGAPGKLTIFLSIVLHPSPATSPALYLFELDLLLSLTSLHA